MTMRAIRRFLGTGTACMIGFGIPATHFVSAQPPVVPEEDPQEAIRKAIEELKNGTAPKPKKDAPAEEPPEKVKPFLPPGNDLENEIRNQQLEMQRAMQEMARQMRGMNGINGFNGINGINGGIVIGPDGIRMPGFEAAQGDFRLGVRVERPTPAMAEQLGLDENGLVISQVIEGLPAAKNGLKNYDILLTLNDKPIGNDPTGFFEQIRQTKAGTPLKFVVLRKGKKTELEDFKLPEQRNLREAFRGRGDFSITGIAGQSIQVTQNNEGFTIRSKSGDAIITIKGAKDEDGEKKIQSIVIDEKGVISQTDTLSKVPAPYQERVQKLLKSIR